MSNDLDLDALEKLCEAATRGPWSAEPKGDGHCWRTYPAGQEENATFWGSDDPDHGSAEADAKLCAAARTAVPALVRRVRELSNRLHWLDMADTALEGLRGLYEKKLDAADCRNELAPTLGDALCDMGVLKANELEQRARAEAAEARVAELQEANDGLLKRDVETTLGTMNRSGELAQRVRALEAAVRTCQEFLLQESGDDFNEQDRRYSAACNACAAVLNGTDGGER